MNYADSVSDFFKSPKWMTNLLLGGLCILIPVIGPIVLLGWLITGFWARGPEHNFVAFPVFDFSHLEKYLQRGLWPFLVTFVVTLAMMPLFFAAMLPMTLSGAFFYGNEDKVSGCFAIIAVPILMLVLVGLIFVIITVIVPLSIRATITQEFRQAFDVAWGWNFLALTWKEVLLSMLFVWVTSVLFAFVGMLIFCVGIYFAAVLNYFSWMHLHKQLYALYLSRGGQPVPQSPKLSDLPPPLPTT